MLSITIRLPKWMACAILLASLGLATKLVAQPTTMNVPLGLIVRQEGDHMTIYLHRVGSRRLAKTEWLTVRGQPDQQGYISTSVAVPIDSHLIPIVEQYLR